VSSIQFEHLTNRLLSHFGPAQVRDFDACVTAASMEPASIAGRWPLPPLNLRHLHDGSFVAWLWQKIDALLSRPTESLPLRDGEIAIQVLGSAIFIKGKTGQLHAFLWENPDHLEYCSSRLVMVTEVPFGSLWLRRHVARAVNIRCGVGKFPDDTLPQESEAYVTWLTKVLMRRVRTQHNMRLVRHQVADSLGIDRGLWHLSHRLQNTGPLDNKTCFRQYNLCVRHRIDLLEIEAVMPCAVGIYAALCESSDFPQEGEPTQRLKRYLHAHGISSRVWRLVLTGGARLLPLIRQFYRWNSTNAVLDCLKVMDGLGAYRKLPSWLSQAIFAEWGNAGAKREKYLPLMGRSMANLRHLVVTAQSIFVKPGDAGEQPIAEVVHWLTEPSTTPLLRAQRQRGWPFLVREAQAFYKTQAEYEAASGESWPIPFEQLQVGRWSLVPMSSSVQLLEEGRLMRNCIHSWTDRCSLRTHLLVSMREDNGRRVGTAHYEWHADHWFLHDAKGPMNRVLAPAHMQAFVLARDQMPDPILNLPENNCDEATDSMELVGDPDHSFTEDTSAITKATWEAVPG